MRRILFSLVCIILISGFASAQDFPKFEIYGGYSITNIGGEDIDNIFSYWNSGNTVEGVSVYTSKYFTRGFNAAVAFNLNRYLGIVGNVQFNTNKIADFSILDSDFSATGKQDADLFSLMAGPRFSLRTSEDITPFAHFLIGMNRVNFDYSLTCTEDGASCSSDITDSIVNEAYLLNESDAGFGFAVGGGIDVNITPAFAVRLIQAEYLKSYHEGDVSFGNTNISFGVVLKFGQE